MAKSEIFQIKSKQSDYVPTGIRFHSEVFFCSGQSRVKLNTEINKFGRNIKVLTILEMSFLKLPKVLKHTRDIKKNFPANFIKNEGNWMKLLITLTKKLRWQIVIFRID